VGARAAQVPLPNTQDGGAMAAVLNSIASTYKATAFRYAADMLKAWKALVVTGLFLPFIIAFFWIWLVKYLTAPLVWMTLLCVDLATLGCTLFCFSKSGNIGKNSFNGIVSYSDANGFSFNSSAAAAGISSLSTVPNGTAAVTPAVSVYDLGAISKRQMYYLGIASAIMTVITWAFSIVLIPRLRVSIATIKVAVDTMNAAPFLAVFPLWPGLALSGFMVWWVALGLFIYSSGQVVPRQCCAQVQQAFTSLFPSYVQLNGGPPSCSSIKCGYTVKMNKSVEYTLIYHGFEFLWTTQFVVAFGILTVSQVVHSAYLHAGGQGVAMKRYPVAHAAWTSVRYYIGSMAFGSLIVATFQFFGFVMSYLSLKLKKVADSNKLIKILLWVANCLVWAFERIVEYLSANAYAVIAIDGSGFCGAAAHGTSMVLSNALRFATLSVVTDAVLFLAKLGTAASSAFFCFVYLDKTYPKGTFSSPLVPVIVVFLTGFAMASLVMAVVHQAVNATILCLIDDEDRNGGTARNAPPALMAATDAGKAWKEESDKRNAETKGGCCSSAPAADAPGQP
jgi:Plasma-membrane choline transporter